MASQTRISLPFEPFTPDSDQEPEERPATELPLASAAWEVEDFASALPPFGPGAQRSRISGEHGHPRGSGRPEIGGRMPSGGDGGHGLSASDAASLRARIAAELGAEQRAEVAAAERRGREQGYREGLAQGGDAARAELVPLAGAVEHALASLREHEQRFLGNLQENTVALALAVARMIVDREVAADIGIVEDLVRRSLGEFPLDQPVRVRVHPADLELLLQGGTGASGEPWDPRRELTWLPDPLVARGGAILEGRERIVDGRVDTGLERVFRRLCNVT